MESKKLFYDPAHKPGLDGPYPGLLPECMLFFICQSIPTSIDPVMTDSTDSGDKAVMSFQAHSLSVLLPIRMSWNGLTVLPAELALHVTHRLQKFWASIHYDLAFLSSSLSIINVLSFGYLNGLSVQQPLRQSVYLLQLKHIGIVHSS